MSRDEFLRRVKIHHNIFDNAEEDEMQPIRDEEGSSVWDFMIKNAKVNVIIAEKIRVATFSKPYSTEEWLEVRQADRLIEYANDILNKEIDSAMGSEETLHITEEYINAILGIGEEE